MNKSIENEKAKVVYVTYMNTTPEKVWNALIDNARSNSTGAVTKLFLTGRSATWSHQDYDSGTIDIDGKAVEVESTKRRSLRGPAPMRTCVKRNLPGHRQAIANDDKVVELAARVTLRRATNPLLRVGI